MNDAIDKQTEWATLELRARELFSPAAPIDEADLFAGRTEQIGRLLDTIAERGKHAILYGERGVGKTSLTNIAHKLIGKALQKDVLPLRKQAAPNDDYDSLWRRIFRDVTYTSSTPAGYGKDEVITHNIAEAYKGMIVPDDVIRELAKISAHITPVIIFDEFDKIESKETKLLMSHTIKALSDVGVNATIIIVGVADDINTLVDEHESIKRNIEEIKMPRMSIEELKEILNKRLPKLQMKMDGDARWKIITLARGLPEYVHSLGWGAVIQAIRDQRKLVSEADVDAAIQTMLRQSDQSSNNAYKKAIHSNRNDARYQEVLLACAMAKTDDEGKFTPTAVIEPLSKLRGKRVTIANFQSHLIAFCGEDRGKILELHGVTRAYKYRFREPKMQPYVIMQGINIGKVSKDALSILSAPEQPEFAFPTEP